MTTEPTPFTRRVLLKNGLLMASAAATVPAFLNTSALAMARAMGGLSSVPGVPDEHILVVVQFSGGNDGLNTVVPVGAPEYYKARPQIGIPEKDALKLSGADGIGLHPGLASLKDMYDSGMVSVIQGVGYPNPNRSHFKSMDIWHTADTSATGDGWLGKYFDAECCGYGKGESGAAVHPDTSAGPPGVAIGRSAPLAMQGRLVQPVSFESAELFRWSGQDIDKDLGRAYDALNRREPAEGGHDTNADFLLRTAMDAQVSSDLIRKAVAVKPLVNYPTGQAAELGRQLQMVASMIRANLRTRVYYVTLGSFDTHAQQGGPQGRHAGLLKGFADATKAFYEDLKKQGNDGRVLTLVFSEFGRRVAQNASQGTDHGTAAPMFLLGPMVRPGVLTAHPSMKDLDEGDLRYTTDFRSVYAGVLNGWMKADADAILGKQKFLAMDVLRGRA
ncbi:MAG: DUF1501 domain-containing protein [Phycisphaerales bacterium]